MGDGAGRTGPEGVRICQGVGQGLQGEEVGGARGKKRVSRPRESPWGGLQIGAEEAVQSVGVLEEKGGDAVGGAKGESGAAAGAGKGAKDVVEGEDGSGFGGGEIGEGIALGSREESFEAGGFEEGQGLESGGEEGGEHGNGPGGGEEGALAGIDGGGGNPRGDRGFGSGGAGVEPGFEGDRGDHQRPVGMAGADGADLIGDRLGGFENGAVVQGMDLGVHGPGEEVGGGRRGLEMELVEVGTRPGSEGDAEVGEGPAGEGEGLGWGGSLAVAQDEDAGEIDAGAGEEGAERVQIGVAASGEEEDEFETEAEFHGLPGGAGEDVGEGGRVEIEFDPEMGEFQGGETLEIGGVEWEPVPGESDTQFREAHEGIDRGRREGKGGGRVRMEPGRGGAEAGGRVVLGVGKQAQGDGLADDGAGWDFDGERVAERGAVGLEAGVDPVALVLGFEGIAFKAGFGPEAGPDRVGEGGELVEPPDGLLGGDQFGERQVGVTAVAVLDAAGPSGAFADGMQNAEADAVAAEGGPGTAFEGIGEGAVGVPFEAAGPGEMERSLMVFGFELDGKGVLGEVAVTFDEAGRDGAPAGVANGGVEAAKHFMVAEADTTEEAGGGIVEGGEGAGAKGDFGGRGLRLAPEREGGGGPGHGAWSGWGRRRRAGW